MSPMMLRKIIQRMRTWARRLWHSLRALSPASNPLATSKPRQPDTIQSPMGGEATASANNSQDAHPLAEPPERRPGEVILGRPGTLAGGDNNLETPDNQDSSSNEASASSCDKSGEIPSSLPEDTSGTSDPPSEQPVEDHWSTPGGNADVGCTLCPNSSDLPFGPPKEAEPPEGNVPKANLDSTTFKEEGKKSEPKIPREIGSRRTGTTSISGSNPRRPPASRPELVCRRSSDSWQWEIILSAEDECQIAKVQHNGKSLGMENGEYRLSSFADSLTIVFRNGEQDEFTMFDGKPLIFKLRNNWTGDGRKVDGITKGHFVVIAPNEWERTCRAPVEPEGCTIKGYTAHYFFRDEGESGKDIIGFRESEVASIRAGFEMIGEHIFDNSEDSELFVGAIPNLEPSPNIEWVRIGEEEKKGWKGENFRSDERTLSEVLNGRQGRFFIRVYNTDAKLLDSGEFRYLRDLKEIRVNGEPYTEQTILLPPSTGHPPTKMRFIGVDGATVRLILPSDVTHAKVQGGDLIVEPHPSGNDISCALESEAGRVDIVLNLPRIWWRIKRDGSESGEWRDTPLTMTRQEFREHAYANATMRLWLPRRIKSVRVGFDDELEPVDRPVKGENDNPIPLADFVDYSQIDQRLNEDAWFNVECGSAVLALIQVSADPVPTIMSFTCEPETVGAGEQTTLRWKTRNAEADGVVIDPEIGAVESSGSLEVALFKTATYTLRLMASGMDDVTKAITVTVVSPLQPNEKPIARVRRVGGEWKQGKGFSCGELRAAGLTAADARRRSMPIDKRRRTTHRANVETMRRLINA